MNLKYLLIVLTIVVYELALLSLSVIWPHHNLVLLLFFLRVPILTGLFLFTLPFIATQLLPQMLKNLFVFNRGLSLLLVVILTCTASVTIVEIGFVGYNNAPCRFNDIKADDKICDASESALATMGYDSIIEQDSVMQALQSFKGYDNFSDQVKSIFPVLSNFENLDSFIAEFLRIFLALILAFPMILYFTRLSVEMKRLYRFLWTVAGLGLSFIIYVFFILENPLSRFTAEITTPIVQEVEGLLGIPIHGLENLLVVYFVVVVIFYLLFGFFLNPKRIQAPALYFLLLSVIALCLFFGAVTFFFDVVRIPVFTTFALLSFAIYIIFAVDHFYEVNELDVNDQKDWNWAELLKQRLSGSNTLVVVCASGGGIQAAGWASQVLKGLDDEFKEKFTRSVGLISSVSGGSVGAMHYLDAFDEEGNLDTAKKDEIFTRATQDSLSATVWGIAYTDLLRLLGLPFLVWGGRKRDRGWALEQRLENALHNKRVSFKTWQESILKGSLPIPVFNATIAENGLRFLLSPITFGKDLGKKVMEFSTLYKGYDIRATTAARLSATFSYVSPICRNDKGQPVYHIADGGYFDNFGVFTAVEWLDNQVLPKCKDFIEKVVIIEIRSFPSATENDEQTTAWDGWQAAFLGPIQTLANVRSSTQKARNEKEVELLEKHWENEVKVHHVPIEFPSKLTDEKGVVKEVEDPPLSWQLTKKQKDTIKKAWESVKNGRGTKKGEGGVIEKLKEYLQ